MHGTGLNAGGTAEHVHIRMMSRPGICNSIPGRFFYYSESISAREPDPESESA